MNSRREQELQQEVTVLKATVKRLSNALKGVISNAQAALFVPAIPAAVESQEDIVMVTKVVKSRRHSESLLETLTGKIKSGNYLDHYKADHSKVLGTGMTGNVFMVKSRITKKKFACKKISKVGMDAHKLAKLRKEVNIMSQLDHPNIIKLVDSFEDAKHLIIISELCTGGELYDHLISSETYTQKIAANVFKQMVTAVNFCHLHGIVHRDLKLENFIITGYDAGGAPHLKLIDFGLSAQIFSPEDASHGPIARMKTTVGTAYYISPEVVDHSRSYGPECDIWSLGVILFMMLTGWPPFNGDDDDAIIKAIKHKEASFDQKMWANMPMAQNLVAQMLIRDPSKRIQGKDILNHAWMKQFECGASSGSLSSDIAGSLRMFSSMQLFIRLAHQAATVTLNPSEVTKMRKAFIEMDRDASGGISKEEFRESMNSHLDLATIDTIFDKIDVNRNGDISYTEFLTASSASDMAKSKSTILAAFDRLDTDGSGFLEATELQTLLEGYLSSGEVSSLLGRADTDHDGCIGRDEFVRLLGTAP